MSARPHLVRRAYYGSWPYTKRQTERCVLSEYITLPGLTTPVLRVYSGFVFAPVRSLRRVKRVHAFGVVRRTITRSAPQLPVANRTRKNNGKAVRHCIIYQKFRCRPKRFLFLLHPRLLIPAHSSPGRWLRFVDIQRATAFRWPDQSA